MAHIKAVRLFVESVLRYGLPADYYAVAIRPNPKRAKGLETALSGYFASLEGMAAASRRKKAGGSADGGNGDVPGEYAALLEEELLPFVAIELPLGLADEQ